MKNKEKTKTVLAICQKFLCPYSYPINAGIYRIPENTTKLECLYGHEMLMKDLSSK